MHVLRCKLLESLALDNCPAISEAVLPLFFR